ncbi:F-box domain containing protein [Trema orientale]|uniref:F-box domain containing protein n=1 Tax=Trema orientale TaxID=63057 RepID=A0A2P5BQY7_TREOI|nr:F-box domain containing protein [Trema orientale]
MEFEDNSEREEENQDSCKPKRQKMMTPFQLEALGLEKACALDACTSKSITAISSAYTPMESSPTTAISDETLAISCHDYSLPDKLWVEIMSRLPVKSLLRCKCVQRPWRRLINTLIHDQTFVTKHLNNYSTDRPSLYIMSYDVSRRARNSFVTMICNQNDDDALLDTIIEDFDLSSFRQQYHMSFPASHCNGIMCISVRQQNVVLLCNPALREFKFITGSCLGPWRINEQTRMVGFGHDTVDDVYKVVRVACKGALLLGAEIHTLGIDHHNSWRKLNTEEHFHVGYTPSLLYPEVQCKSFIYWLTYGCRNSNPVIISFDVHDEDFQTISLPTLDDNFSATETCSDVSYKLALWNESVALFKFYVPRCRCGKRSTACFSPKPIEMWVLDESSKGPEKSYFWTKHLIIPPLDRCYRPQVFWTNDELILTSFSWSTDHTRKISFASSYNLVTQKVRRLRGIPETLEGIGSFAYVQSLVSIT